MKSIRLLPVLLVVGSLLLLFKIFGLVSGNLYMFGSGVLVAQEADAVPSEQESGDDTQNDANGEQEGNRAGKPNDAAPIVLDRMGNIKKLSEMSDIPPTEIDFLERLRERRTVLDEREVALDVRESIIRAAEIRLESRAIELRKIEADIAALVEKKEDQEDQQFASLVTTYEAMKAKDAARIFDRLDMVVLVRLVERMKPKNFAAVMASMNEEKAEALTINLANPSLTRRQQAAINETDEELPQIIGQ